MTSLKSIQRAYPLKGGTFYALHHISLDIREGEFVSIMGPSGSGKSTLLHVLGLYDSASTGKYRDDLTVYENLEIPPSYRNLPKQARDGVVCDLLDRFHRIGKKDLYPNQIIVQTIERAGRCDHRAGHPFQGERRLRLAHRAHFGRDAGGVMSEVCAHAE